VEPITCSSGDAATAKRRWLGPRIAGVAAIEFALVLIVLLLIVAGVVEFGRAFWHYDTLAKATRDGARFMSMEPVATIGDAATLNAARQLVINAANAANVSPALTAENVSVNCLDTAFQPVACVDGTAPANVRVGISTTWGAASDYTVTIGGVIPFFLPTGGSRTFTATFTPHTTMRYMQ
jgi:Flp pilus assembly protein TadG